MNKIIYYLLITIFVSSISFSQETDSLIQLYPGFGDTLDRFDRDYFGLLQNIDGFEHATFYIRNDKYLISKITFTYYGILRDTTAIQNIGVLHSEQLKIKQLLLKCGKQDYTPREVIISTKNGKTYSGKLDMFSKDNVYLSSMQNLQAGESIEQDLIIPVSKLDTITFEGESEVFSSVGWGVLAGIVLGGLIGLASGDDEGGFVNFTKEEKAVGAGGFLGLLGGLIGLIFGLTSSSDDEIIQINSQVDMIKLKGYAKYRLKYEKPYPKQYVEVE